MNIFTGYHN